MGTKVGSKAERAGDSLLLEGLARVGLVAYGVVHVLIGWLALQIAWGGMSGRSADISGALTTVADQPFGKALLWLVVIGMVALALWQTSEAIWGFRNRVGGKRLRKRVSSGAKAVVYAALGVSVALVTVDAGSSSSLSQQEATWGVLAWPGGQVIVVVTGLVIIGVGVAVLGQVGYIARGLALSVVGGLIGYAALTFDAQQAKGLDGAMQTILEQLFGQFLLTAVAMGFVAFGLFAFLQARYHRM